VQAKLVDRLNELSGPDALAELTGGLEAAGALPGALDRTTLERFERARPQDFLRLRNSAYLACYESPAVHEAIGSLGFAYNAVPLPTGCAVGRFEPAADLPRHRRRGPGARAEPARGRARPRAHARWRPPAARDRRAGRGAEGRAGGRARQHRPADHRARRRRRWRDRRLGCSPTARTRNTPPAAAGWARLASRTGRASSIRTAGGAGIRAVRVADGSIMPADCEANTNFTTIMIGGHIAARIHRSAGAAG
jgi:hypothetical protein